MNYNFSLVLNSLSFGFCSYNILSELYKRGIAPNLFLPPSPQADISAYDSPQDFQYYLSTCASKARRNFSKEMPQFKLWHIDENRISKKTSLMTFYELDSPTHEEINMLNSHDNVLVTCRETEQIFKDAGVQSNVIYVPLGYDTEHFKKKDKKYHEPEVIQFSLFGKFEKRKHHEKVIKSWIKRFGGEQNIRLNLHVYNSFFTPQQNQQILHGVFEGKKPFNVNAIGFVRTLAELNDSFNATDIVIDMSGGEGFSLPSFHTVGLGKHAVLHNCSAIKDWAADSGAVLVEPSGKEDAYDGVFFVKGASTNQGQIHTWDEDAFIAGCEKAIENYRRNPINEAGKSLRTKYKWKDTVDTIISTL